MMTAVADASEVYRRHAEELVRYATSARRADRRTGCGDRRGHGRIRLVGLVRR